MLSLKRMRVPRIAQTTMKTLQIQIVAFGRAMAASISFPEPNEWR